MNCWKCLKQIEDKVTFRSICYHCDTNLHVCKNCRFYSPGKPNDCAVFGTEKISDPEKVNFCDEFKVKANILGNEDKFKKSFNELFK